MDQTCSVSNWWDSSHFDIYNIKGLDERAAQRKFFFRFTCSVVSRVNTPQLLPWAEDQTPPSIATKPDPGRDLDKALNNSFLTDAAGLKLNLGSGTGVTPRYHLSKCLQEPANVLQKGSAALLARCLLRPPHSSPARDCLGLLDAWTTSRWTACKSICWLH